MDTIDSETIQASETGSLIASSKVEGTRVFDAAGSKLGTVRNFMVDKRSGQVAYVVISTGGFLGLGQAYHPLPWSALRYEDGKGGYVVEVASDMLSGGPSFRPDTAPIFDDAYGARIDEYYRPPAGTISL
ncbi:PRC-barrel domain-containing protein [Sphingomonas sp. BIUV-7]|uniref:PRC-barrel domain-containing protein n=1 Tax=Sphingomonas natans TaxID=3063330 RepID=A0ABT8Y780_9SPHN|nr:PRC-barrel domain-containing protein [Sphingomonas sp. BIUV-7]MDO6414174.1 PRC-barrel domain-containing protein [Sphingomonas sp. BIUV-7]